jgi:GT2 family glycosyltransferase
MKKCHITAIILNWETSALVISSIYRLIRECDEIIVVDSGTKDLSAFKYITFSGRVRLVALGENKGYSYGKNIGIHLSRGQYVFSLNGDILYVPGTLEQYTKILEANPDAANVGFFDWEYRRSYGSLGSQDRANADTEMPLDYKVSDFIPISWIQYGLYRGDVIRNIPLPLEPPFNSPGYGYEDDWHYHQLKECGYTCLAANAPVYYHKGSVSKPMLSEAGLANMEEERRKAFEARWGYKNWYNRLKSGELKETLRPNPNRNA